jgi:arylsulfatase
MHQPSPAGFEGRIGRTREESTPWWPPVPRAAVGSPNIVVIYMDDMGYSDIGCYGSEIQTPNMDAIAARGLRFNHYTTHPICSPARGS